LRAAVSFGSRDLKLWNLAVDQELRMFGHGGEGQAWVVGRQIVSGLWVGGDRNLRVWDLPNGAVPATAAKTGHSACVRSLALSPDGLRAISASMDNSLKVWETKTGRELRTLSGHSGGVAVVAVASDGRHAVSASNDKTLRVWDLETGQELRTLSGHTGWVWHAFVSPDGERAISGSMDGTVRVWDLGNGRPIFRFDAGAEVHSLAMTPNGRLAVAGLANGALKVWNLERGQELCTLHAPEKDEIGSLVVTPDGRYAVTASSWSFASQVWDLRAGRALRQFTGNRDRVMKMAISPDGRFIVSSDWKKTKIWELDTGKELCTFDHGTAERPNAIAMMPDPRYVVTAHLDSTVRVWDVNTGKDIAAYTADTEIGALATAPDGTIVAGDEWGAVHFLTLEDPRNSAATPSTNPPIHLEKGIFGTSSGSAVAAGVELFDRGLFQEALQAFESARSVKHHDAEAWYGIGITSLALGHVANALAALDRALYFRPYYAEALFAKGVAFEKMTRYGEALSAYQQARGLNEKLAETWNTTPIVRACANLQRNLSW
jgi:WD40 repeat protein